MPDDGAGTEPDGEFVESVGDGLQETADRLSDQIRASKNFVETDDFKDALVDGPTPVFIATGKFADDGSMKKLKVLLQDPGSESVIVAYLAGMGQARQKPEVADLVTRSLWRSVVVSPKEICEPEHYKKISSAFRNNLTFAIMSFLGIDGDFLGRVEGMSTPAERRLAKELSKPSPRPTANIPPKSAPGPSPISAQPTPTSPPSDSASGAKPSSTLNGPSSTPSASASTDGNGNRSVIRRPPPQGSRTGRPIPSTR